jgi:hypothetical protein
MLNKLKTWFLSKPKWMKILIIVCTLGLVGNLVGIKEDTFKDDGINSDSLNGLWSIYYIDNNEVPLCNSNQWLYFRENGKVTYFSSEDARLKPISEGLWSIACQTTGTYTYSDEKLSVEITRGDLNLSGINGSYIYKKDEYGLTRFVNNGKGNVRLSKSDDELYFRKGLGKYLK